MASLSKGPAAAAAAGALPVHPYYPLGLEIVGYLANEYSLVKLLGLFAAGCVVILGSASTVARRVNPGLPASELAILMWFTLCGSIHLFFEGYFAFNHLQMAGLQTLFGQLWKEYAKSDSRYLTSDPFVLCMETITAVCWGPLSFALAGMVAAGHPLRHPLQLLVSLGQLYGDVLYYATNYFNEVHFHIVYSRPEPFYYYGYYILMNAFWIVIPLLLILQSCRVLAAAVALAQAQAQAQGASAPVKSTSAAVASKPRKPAAAPVADR